MFTASPRRSTVRSAAALSTCAVSGGSRSSEPTSLIRQPARSAARSSTSSSMIRSSGCSSDSGRDRLSVDSSQSVTTSTPASALQRSTSSILSAPAWWPKLTSPAPAARAQRRLPSHMTPTWRGTGRPASWRRNRRSYIAYSRSRAATRALYAGEPTGPGRSAGPGDENRTGNRGFAPCRHTAVVRSLGRGDDDDRASRRAGRPAAAARLAARVGLRRLGRGRPRAGLGRRLHPRRRGRAGHLDLRADRDACCSAPRRPTTGCAGRPRPGRRCWPGSTTR